MSVRDGVPFENMTIEEQATVRMWIAIGLKMEVCGGPSYTRSIDHEWVPYNRILQTKNPLPVGRWCYRLKQ